MSIVNVMGGAKTELKVKELQKDYNTLTALIRKLAIPGGEEFINSSIKPSYKEKHLALISENIDLDADISIKEKAKRPRTSKEEAPSVAGEASEPAGEVATTKGSTRGNGKGNKGKDGNDMM